MFCEKCGNKIKEGYKFCDKCGTKVKESNKKKEVKEEEKVVNEFEEKEEVIIESPQVISYQPKKKSGKGKVVLLTILNLILLATTILFFVLWLIKPSDKSCDSSSSNTFSDTNKNEKKDTDNKKETKTNKDSEYIGKWEQNVDYKRGNEVVKRTYGMIEIKSDGTFNSVFYDKDDMSNSERLSGEYSLSGNKIYITYSDEGKTQNATLYVNDGKMCIGSKDCEDYLVKDSYNNKVVIHEDIEESDIEYIDYYELDNNINVSGTPTTFVIKNGEVIDTII